MGETGSTTDETSVTWDELREMCTSLSDGAFIATTQADGQPHLAWVGIGFDDHGKLWTATEASSQKARNLRHEPRVALHWPERPGLLVFMRARARPVDDRGETEELWHTAPLPYDPAAYFGTVDNPELLFVELTPTRASVLRGEPGDPPARWRP